jgi:integrase
VQRALEAWLKVHPLARGVGLLDEQPLFVRLGRHGHEEPLPLSAVGVHRLVRRSCAAAGVPERLCHPHALRAYWATHCLEAGVSVHTVSARLGHVDLRTTARYAAPRPSRSTTSPTCWTAATRPPAARVKRCSWPGEQALAPPFPP